MQNSNIFELKSTIEEPLKYTTKDYGEIEVIVSWLCIYSLLDLNVDKKQLEVTMNEQIKSNIASFLNSLSGSVDCSIICKELQQSVPKFKFQINGIAFNQLKITEVVLTNNSLEILKTKQKSVPVVVDTLSGEKNGQDKCPACGATEISLNPNTGKLKCHFCRTEFEPKKVEGFSEDIAGLEGQVFGSGAQDIVADAKDMLTFKCSSCGAEVVIDTASSHQARCHWCRNVLSVNQQIPNGSVPDVVLPFSIKKEEAKAEIEKFVKKRKFFANSIFKKEFTTDNIMGVYFPYMVVDVNGHANLIGQGEQCIRRYTVKRGEHSETYYDANVYDVEREFDVAIQGLTVESSSDKLNKNANDKTTNIINSIMPFDIENSVKWNANYLKGFTSEKRDTNIDQLRPLVATQSKDIARFAANDTLKEYDRGVAWASENFDIKGQQWRAAYLPVWLYSYQEVKGNKKLLHYVAVNGRTKETMGSVPLSIGKLTFFSILMEIAGILLMFFVDFDYSYIFLSLGIIFFLIVYFRYRNSNARHKHELETKKTMSNLRKVDRYVQKRTRLSNSMIQGQNNTRVSGVNYGFGTQFINQINSQNPLANVISNEINRKK